MNRCNIFYILVSILLFSSCNLFEDSKEKPTKIIHLNGDNYISTDAKKIADFNEGTFEVVFRPNVNSPGTIFQIGSQTDDTRHFRLYFSNGNLFLQNRFTQLTAKCESDLDLNRFYEVMVSSDGSEWKIYIDGILQKLNYEVSVSQIQNGDKSGWFKEALQSDDKNTLNLGVLNRPKGKINYFIGDIAKFKLWNQVFETDQIKEYSKGKNELSNDELILSYTFEFSENGIIKNTVSKDYSGKLIGEYDAKSTFVDIGDYTKNRNKPLYILISLLLICGLVTNFLTHNFRFSFGRSLFILETPKNYIKGLDGLRGISIILVLVSHLGWLLSIPYEGFNKRLIQLISGTTGVNIFFAISGFLITSILLKELKKTGSINFKNFFARRFIRLLPPLIILYLFIIILMKLEYLSPDYIAVLLSFTYLYNFIPKAKYYTSELGSTWSLAVEEQFYLIWPFLLKAFKKIQVRLFVIGFLVALSILFIYMIDKVNFEYEINGNSYNNLTRGFFTNRWFIPAIAPIMIGCAASILLFQKTAKYELLFNNNIWALLIAILLFCSALFLPGQMLKAAFISQAFGVSLFLIWIYFNQKSWLVKFLEFKPLSFIGKISYGIYVYQGLFLGTGPSAEIMLQEYPLNIVATFLVAIFSYFFIERSFLKLKKYF